MQSPSSADSHHEHKVTTADKLSEEECSNAATHGNLPSPIAPHKVASLLSRLSSDDSIPRGRVRPHLSYLRSEWTSQDLRAPGTIKIEDGVPQPILLPPQQKCILVAQEARRLGLLGLTLSAVSSVVTSVSLLSRQHNYGWTQPLHTFSSVVLTVLIWTDHIRMNWALCNCLLAVSTIYHINTMVPFMTLPYIMSILGIFAIILSHRLDNLHNQHLEQISAERKEAQERIDKSVEALANQRSAFLSTISQEVQDAALMVITTLEQFSPSTILTNTHELLSACSIAVPIASISAINTTIKQVCYVSSHLGLLSHLTYEEHAVPNSLKEEAKSDARIEFDIGDLVQNVADAMAGMAANLDVNLILYHSDNGMHYTSVIGNEGAIRHGLLNLLRNILEGCTPGACIELGLNITASDTTGRLTVTFEIIHTASPAIPEGLTLAVLPNANITSKILEYIDAKFSVNGVGNSRTRYEVILELEPGNDNSRRKLLLLEEPAMLMYKQYANITFSSEPTLEELIKFIESLKGLKMVLHARERSVFAKHLTSCLASWNADISHVPVVNQDASATFEGSATPNDYSSERGSPRDIHSLEPSTPSTAEMPATTSPRPGGRQVPSPLIAEEQIHSIPPSFVLIDDDVETLERKLREFRNQPPVSANVLQHHQQLRRHKSSKSVNAPAPNFFHHGTTAIIHFTSPTNYKKVRDALQLFSAMPALPPFSLPRLVVVPKPAGPRRFLTALHTAWNNSIVEPHFLPIATSPLSPAPYSIASAFSREQNTPVTPSGSSVDAAYESDKGSRRGSPNEGGGGRRRPTSGVYSPQQITQSSGHESTSEANNYFTMMNGTVTQGQSSPGGTSLHHRAAAAAAAAAGAVSGRRRSHTELGQQQEQEPGTADHASPMSTSPLPPTPSESPREGRRSRLTPTSEPTQDEAMKSEEGMAPSLGEPATKVPGGSSPSAGSDKGVSQQKTARRMTNLKLNKKRKSGKGSAFANVVSPPINVLIVEDNMINQAILSTWMKKHKINCSVASNGQEALEMWKGGGFHLVLMDIQLPVMDGIEATKKIRAIEKEQQIGVLPMNTSSSTSTTDNGNSTSSPTNTQLPSTEGLPPSIFRSPVIIVALTASSLESDRHAALAAGCNDFLTKPVSLEWLEKKIIEWGCMQALIDFEGWRKWKRLATDKPALKSPQVNKELPTTLASGSQASPGTTSGAGTSSSDTTTTAGVNADNENLAAQSDNQTASPSEKQKSKGIILAGAAGLNKRRFSAFDERMRRPGSLGKSGTDIGTSSLRLQGDRDRRQKAK
ncbi:hypothetical protein BX666DRAFT_2031108 [Dichotomocladium elegans]|nr:hypothetical protein BX666DRAFT_2031108 [Dichotomocladium elegans]